MNEMTDTIRIQHDRSVILATRIRFAPQLQPIKEIAIDRIIENILYVNTEKQTADDINRIFKNVSGGYSLPINEIIESLNRLIKNSSVEAISDNGSNLYGISDVKCREMENTQKDSEYRIKAILDKLLKNSVQNPLRYQDPFLRVLAIIFSQLGEESVLILTGQRHNKGNYIQPSISTAIRSIRREYQDLDINALESAIIDFFQEADPAYNELKWNIAQNYFLTKAVGVDAGAATLSKDLFEDAIFYIDTNIIIEALESSHHRHDTFQTFINLCSEININVIASRVSIEELNGWVDYHYKRLPVVVDNVPEGLEERVDSLFFDIYLQQKKAGKPFDIDEIFKNFKQPENDIKSRYNIPIDEDISSKKYANNHTVNKFAESIRGKYLKSRGKVKKQFAAFHDAIIIYHIDNIRSNSTKKIWLVTSDTSLPDLPIELQDKSSPAITLDAILQWMAPVSLLQTDDFATIFSDMLKRRLLPQGRFFSIEDFLIFQDINISCKNLPAKDVEDCIRFIRKNAANLNPSNPADREKLSYEVSKFFADSGREYKQEVARLEGRIVDLEEQHSFEIREVNDSYTKKIEEVEQSWSERMQIRDTEWSERLKISNMEIELINKRLADDESKKRKSSLIKSAIWRIILFFTILIILESSSIYFSIIYGSGANDWQKVTNSLPIIAAITAICFIIGRFIVRKEHTSVLGEGFAELLKHSKDD